MKTNKQIIEALRDNADLAWAAYGFFDRGEYDNGELGYRYENETEQNKDKMPQHKITYPDILTDEYKDLRAYNNISDSNGKYQPIKPFYKKSKFQGDMNKEQARQLLSDDKSINQIRKAKYTLVHHIPNTLSGFSVTLFYNHTTKTYTLAFRGTEMTSIDGFTTDVLLTDGCITLLGFALPQYLSLLKLKEAIKQAIQKDMKQGRECEDSRLIVTGHLRDTKTLDSIKVA